MSDNVQFNIATDQEPISGAHYQKIKIAFGESDEFTLVSEANPLPVDASVTIDTTGLATEAKQDDGNTLLSIIGGLLAGTITVSGTVNANTGLSQPLTDTQLRTTPVPVSGTVTANAGTNLNTSLLALEGGGNLAAIAGKDFATQTTLAAILAKIIAAPATEATLASILAKIIAAPATEAKQDTGNTSLATIAGKDFATQTTLAAIKAKTDNIPALGQALAAASTPVVLTAAQITTLTPPAAITGFSTEATLALIKAKTDNIDVALSTRTKPADQQHVIVDTAPSTAVTNAGTFATQADLQASSSATGACTNVSSTAYEASHVLKSSAGRLYRVIGYNSKTSSQFIQLHNSTSVPADTAVPVVIFNVAPQSNFSLEYSDIGRYFSTGIVICNSSAGATKVIGSADCWFDAQVL